MAVVMVVHVMKHRAHIEHTEYPKRRRGRKMRAEV